MLLKSALPLLERGGVKPPRPREGPLPLEGDAAAAVAPPAGPEEAAAVLPAENRAELPATPPPLPCAEPLPGGLYNGRSGLFGVAAAGALVCSCRDGDGGGVCWGRFEERA